MTIIRGTNIQIVYRRRPRETIYIRKVPVTVYRPTPAQAELRLLFRQAIQESKLLAVEQVAKLVGGEVVEINGKKAIRMPDGRILMKHMAYVAYVIKNYRSSKSRIYRVPAWLEEIRRRYFLSIPTEKALEVLSKSVS
jgi:hypothetical protein